MTQLKVLSIDLLVIDADTQARVSISDDAVDSYVEIVQESGEWPFPAIDVFFDGSKYYVADGFHRYLTAKKLKRASIPCVIHKGTSKHAKIFGMTANDNHGLRMSREDKRACVEWLLKHYPDNNQEHIAQLAGVTRRTVVSIIAERKAANAPAKKSTAAKPAGKDVAYSIPADPAPPKKVTQAERIKHMKSLIVQHLERAVRGVDDLADMKPNKTAHTPLVRAIQAIIPKIKSW